MKRRNFRMIETNGIKLQVVVEGEGPLLLLLHGFPQCWYLWRQPDRRISRCRLSGRRSRSTRLWR